VTRWDVERPSGSAVLFALSPATRKAWGMSDSSPPDTQDVALLYAPTDDGAGARILRARQGRLEAGEVRPTVDGQPLLGREVVKLHARPGMPRVCDVEVVLPRSAQEEQTVSSGRPAAVASDEYRANWDRIFGCRRLPAGPLN
jgi:hypothetical protein